MRNSLIWGLGALAIGFVPVRALGQDQEVVETLESGDSEFDTLVDSFTGGESWLLFRYRYEYVDQARFGPKARASTLLTRLGYRTAAYHGFKLTLELDDVTEVGADGYNSTVNNQPQHPVIPDPAGTEVNQAFLEYGADESTRFRLGRQRVILDNSRFIGSVGWRQNEQTYDGVSVRNTSFEDFALFYSFFQNANRIFGEDSPVGDGYQNSHILNLAYNLDFGQFVLYWYHLNFEDLDLFSTSTMGARFSGEADPESLPASILYVAEYARQQDISGNPNDVDAYYLFGELGTRFDPLTVRVGYERLSGSGDVGDKFSTPLATLFKFNGWADRFLVTPDTGLNDLYVQASVNIADVKINAVYHEFTSDRGSMDYGTEWNLGLAYPLHDHVTLGLRYANYQADEFAADTVKAWGWLEVRF